jgi:hypothetical protein
MSEDLPPDEPSEPLYPHGVPSPQRLGSRVCCKRRRVGGVSPLLPPTTGG